jgi:Flp pilus assembly protein TadB
MNIDITGIVITICSLALPAIIVTVVVIGKYLNNKRQYEAMTKAMELGKTPEEIKALFAIEPKKRRNGDGKGLLKSGIVIIGVALGIAAMNIVLSAEGLLASALLIFVFGISLLAAYFLTREKEKAE